MYQEKEIKKILIDLKNKVEACVEIGLGDLSYTLNEALNLIEQLTGLDAYLEDVRKDD